MLSRFDILAIFLNPMMRKVGCDVLSLTSQSAVIKKISPFRGKEKQKGLFDTNH